MGLFRHDSGMLCMVSVFGLDGKLSVAGSCRRAGVAVEAFRLSVCQSKFPGAKLCGNAGGMSYSNFSNNSFSCMDFLMKTQDIVLSLISVSGSAGTRIGGHQAMASGSE